jgi:iron(III) transport system substrate-binding protein
VTALKRFYLRLAVVFVLSLTAAAPLREAFAADAKIIEAAKKEGELAWWSTIAQDQSQRIVDEFMKLYPFIKASYWRSGSVGLHNKILIEARAGRSSWDVISQTAPEFIFDLKQKKLIAPYNSPERGQFSADLKDRDGYWTGTYALPTGLGFNHSTGEEGRRAQELQRPARRQVQGRQDFYR